MKNNIVQQIAVKQSLSSIAKVAMITSRKVELNIFKISDKHSAHSLEIGTGYVQKQKRYTYAQRQLLMRYEVRLQLWRVKIPTLLGFTLMY